MFTEPNNNDLIRISNTESHFDFCVKILEKLKTGRQGVLKYFTKLHDYILNSEDNPIEGFNIYLREFSETHIESRTIMDTTGSAFIPFELFKEFRYSYPATCVLEWTGTLYLETCDNWFSAIDYGTIHFANSVTSEMRASINKNFNSYVNRIFDAYYLYKFGPNHPFNIQLNNYLFDNFPYKDPEFKNMIKVLFENRGMYPHMPLHSADEELDQAFSDIACPFKDCPIVKRHPDGRKILIETVEELITLAPSYRSCSNAPFYLELRRALLKIGVDRPLTREDLDFRH